MADEKNVIFLCQMGRKYDIRLGTKAFGSGYQQNSNKLSQTSQFDCVFGLWFFGLYFKSQYLIKGFEIFRIFFSLSPTEKYFPSD